MNKYQESFEKIKEECSKYHNFDIIDDFITLKELVERATPKKKEKINDALIPYSKCPICHSIIANIDRYCSNCGQRVDGLE